MPRTRFDGNDHSALFTDRPDQDILGGSGTATMIGRVISPSASIAVGKFLHVNPATTLGRESSGSPGLITVDPTVVVSVYLVGPRVPQPGDLLICRFVDFRWAAEHGGSGTGGGFTISGCPCTQIPGTLFFHVKKLAPAWLSGVYPDTLLRQPKPADLARYATDPVGYYGTNTFTSLDGFYKYRYWFGCQQGIYFVQGMLTDDSVAGFPNKFVIMNWLVGVPGNSCLPFSLANGVSMNTTFQEQGISINGGGPA